MTIPIDLDWGISHGWIEATVLALLRRNEVMRYSKRMSTASALSRLYPVYCIYTYRVTLERLEKNGYLTMESVYIRGKYPYKIYSLTDKTWREYQFGE